jgi:hypothetical protein
MVDERREGCVALDAARNRPREMTCFSELEAEV